MRDYTTDQPRLFVPRMREPDYAVVIREDMAPRGWRARQAAPMPALCSCGERGVHEVARRQTIDGQAVSLDSEGQVWLGSHMPMTVGRRLPELAARLVVEECGWFTASEMSAVVSAARWVAGHCWRGHREALRARVEKLARRGCQ